MNESIHMLLPVSDLQEQLEQHEQEGQQEKPLRHRRRCFGGILSCSSSCSFSAELVPLKEEVRYALVKGRQSGIWSFPKGHSKKGEEPLATARREIEEETGLSFTNQEPHHQAQRLKGGIYFHFECQPHHINNTLPHDTWEIEEVRWVTLEEMSTLPVNAGVRDFLRRYFP